MSTKTIGEREGDRVPLNEIPFKQAEPWPVLVLLALGGYLASREIYGSETISTDSKVSYTMFLFFVVSGLRYVRDVAYGVELKLGQMTGRIFGSGVHWVFPFVTRVDVVTTRERVDRIEGLVVPLADGMTVTLHAFVRWTPDWRIARWAGGLMQNTFFGKRASAVIAGIEEALESEITALLGSIVIEEFVRKGSALRLIFTYYFQVGRGKLAHYDEEFFKKDGVLLPHETEEEKQVGPRRKRRTVKVTVVNWLTVEEKAWPGGSIPPQYRLDFYRKNRGAIIRLLESGHERDEHSVSYYEDQNGIVVHEVGFNAQLSPETINTLATQKRGRELLRTAVRLQRAGKDAVAAALALQDRTTHTTTHVTGIGGSLPLFNIPTGKEGGR